MRTSTPSWFRCLSGGTRIRVLNLALAGVGVGVGAIGALTIAGAGANIPEFVILSRLARSRALVVFAGYMLAVAMAGGVLAQLVAGRV